jgi:pimeloyl-ACP methyl ester carboxylesterase
VDVSEAARSVVVEANGLRQRVVVWGRDGDPTVVLVHGNGAHAHWWAPLVPSLVPGWRVVAPDLRGPGESAWPEPPAYGVGDFDADLAAVVAALAPGSIALVGHSMGGRIALWYAAHRPADVRALALVDTRVEPVVPEEAARYRPSAASRERRGRGYPTYEAAAAAFRFVPDETDVPADVVGLLARHAIVERGPGDWAYRFDRAVLRLDGDGAGDLRRVLPRIACPTLVAGGATSWVCDAASRRRLVDALSRGRGTACEIPGGHHGLVAHGARVGALLRGFLERTR